MTQVLGVQRKRRGTPNMYLEAVVDKFRDRGKFFFFLPSFYINRSYSKLFFTT